MGWFDNEQGSERPKQTTPNRPAQRTTPTPNPPDKGNGGGSTLGRQVHVDGTIVCGEDLTILGKVEGTIRAKGTLVIAKEADVQATIDGHRVMVHGKVEGNVHGDERVVLGPTGELNGNIESPTLEITEGAYFKGNVDMPEPGRSKDTGAVKPSTEKPSAAKPAAAKPAAASPGSSAGDSAAKMPGGDQAGDNSKSDSSVASGAEKAKAT